jgi:hypothetical protein
VEPSDERIERVLQAAKTSNRQLTDEEVVAAAAG